NLGKSCSRFALRNAPLRCLQCPRHASHRDAATAVRGPKELSFHDNYGNRRAPPPKGFVAGDGAPIAEPSSAVTTRSPSFRPSTTSVMMPSLIPVLICLGSGRLAPDGKIYTVR